MNTKDLDKKSIIITIILILCIFYFIYSLSRCNNEIIVQEPVENIQQTSDAGNMKNPPIKDPELNGIFVQYIGGEYLCWIKRKDFIFIDSDKVTFELEFENYKYRLYILNNNARVLNFRGGKWDKAAYYLGIKIPRCIE